MGADADPHVAIRFVALDGISAELGYPHERLGVEKQQDAGDSVGQGFAGAGEQFPQPCHALVLGDCWSGFGGVVAHFHPMACAGVVDETIKVRMAFLVVGPGGEPGFDVLLGAVRCGALMGRR
ncbi:MAG: hypothetical protein ABWY20_08995 [Mycobacterium sp.]